jgi:low temperature requirement protein LtrA
VTAVEELLGRETAEEQERRTSYLELFFDLVFVFAITQVTTLIIDDPTAAGFARGVLVLWLVWWAWGGYAWMTNAISIESRGVRIAFLAATLGCFFVALAVPGAYGGEDLWFAIPYVAIRVAQIGLYMWGLRLDPGHQAAIRKLAPWFLVAPLFVLAGAIVDGDAQIVLWLLAVAIDVGGALSVAGAGFRVSASHFAERYGLFMIIALGESIVAIGLGAAALERDTEFAVAVSVAFAGVALLWWAYFDFLALGAERALTRVPGVQRGPLARDLYSFFHFAFVVGVILYAVGAKKTLEHPDDPLSAAGRWALGLGVAAYLMGSVIGRLRAIRAVAWERAIGAASAIALVVVLREVDALWVLAAVVALLALVIVVESVRLREFRRQLHAEHHAP